MIFHFAIDFNIVLDPSVTLNHVRYSCPIFMFTIQTDRKLKVHSFINFK